METTIHIAIDVRASWAAPIHVEKQRFAPPKNRLFLIFAQADLRPPVYEEMVSDMANLIHKVVAGYVDQSCVELHFDDLVSECWAKTVEMNSKGLLSRCRNRVEYFKQYKTALRNHICSLVQKHRFTEKRTGIKPPPKDQRNNFSPVSTKPQEVRIDDPDNGFQISDLDSGDDAMKMRELMEEVTVRLEPVEVMVLEQIMAHNERACWLAQQESEIGREVGEPLRVRIRIEHLAKGLGSRITPELFQQIHDDIKEKCLFMKNHMEDDPRLTAAMATLLQFFGVQIPRSIDEITRKRALMLAAQHQFDRLKDNEGIKEAMRLCNIPIPEVRNDRFKCFGIMFQKHHRSCINCGMREGCELKASNFGLGEITISHKLLGSRHARVPVIRPTFMANDTAFADSEREEEILTFLDENFRRVKHQGEICYRHKDRLDTEGMQLIFSIGKQTSPLRLRFITPADELKPSLKLESGEKGGRPSWYLPDDMNASEAVNLIRAHAQMTFTKA
jgi:hypothetical protein